MEKTDSMRESEKEGKEVRGLLCADGNVTMWIL